MPKAIKKQSISGGYVSKMELTNWGKNIGVDYIKKFEDLVFVSFFNNQYGIFPLSEYRSGKFAFLYHSADVGKAISWLFDDNTSLNHYDDESEGFEISDDEYDSESNKYELSTEDKSTIKADKEVDNKMDNGDTLDKYLESVKKKLTKCGIEIEIQLKKIYTLDFDIPEHIYEETELKLCNYPYYFEVKLIFPQLIKKYDEIIERKEGKNFDIKKV